MSRSKRKWDHIRYAIETGQDGPNGFDDIMFVHQSLPNVSLHDVSLDHRIGELSLSSPIFINAMTGGGGERTYQINRDLAIVAKQTGISMAVGSQMSALKNSDEIDTYKIVRKENPNGIVFGNLGSEATLEQAKRAVHMLEANALQIHLNVVQELTMPEGDRDFTNALKRIESICSGIDVPVIVKEVGFGISHETASSLANVGVSMIDVGGFGGTNFAKIENERRRRFLSFFNHWGISTAASIVETKQSNANVVVIGSGGIQSSLQIVKSLALGVEAVGVAGAFLKILFADGIEGLIDEITDIHEEMKLMMTALGVRTIDELHHVPLVISGPTFHWLSERGFDTKIYSQRKKLS